MLAGTFLRRGETMRPDPERVRRVAVVGTGTIGGGWAALFLAQGLDVVATDPGADAEAKLHAMIDQVSPALTSLGLAGVKARGQLEFVAKVADAVNGVEFIQESAPDREPLKVALFAEIDRYAPPDTIIASSSSGFLPERLAAQCRHRGRCIIGHPFAPSYLLPLVEIVGFEGNPKAVLDWAVAFYAGLGKQPLLLKKGIEGYIANRIQHVILEEAARLVDSGVCDFKDVDDAVTGGVGLRWAFMGPALCYHFAGGRGGIDHSLAHFGWWGSETSKQDIRESVEQKADGRSMEDLERWRDANLVALLKARKPLE
jgi:carnitine 3-dehydrogenase